MANRMNKECPYCGTEWVKGHNRYVDLTCPRCGASAAGISRHNESVGYSPADIEYELFPGNKTQEEMEAFDLSKGVEGRVKNTLRRIASKFPSAGLLASAVEELGLFDGEACWPEGSQGWWYTPWVEGEKPFLSSKEERGCITPTFTATLRNDGGWNCLVGTEAHWAVLHFSPEGEVDEVSPDRNPSQRFWEEGSRAGQILALLK